MELDFPDTPNIGDTWPDPPVTGEPQWTWDGVKWAGRVGRADPLGVGIFGRTSNGAWAPVPVVVDQPPANPVTNTLWFDEDVGKLFLWYTNPTGSQWIEVIGAGPQGAQGEEGPQGEIGATGPAGPMGAPPYVSSTPPASPAANMLWFDSSDARLYISLNSQWVEVAGG